MPEKFTHFFDHFNYASLLQNTIRVLIIIAIAILIWIAIRVIINRVGARIVKRAAARGEHSDTARRRADTLTSLLRKVIGAVYWIAMALTILSQIGVDIGAMVAAAGVLGLAFSFGAQELIKNYIAGFFMVLEDQISVDDIAAINGTTGTVEQINFRTTVVRGSDGAVHVFTNNTINSLTNLTRAWSGYLYEVAVAYDEDPDRVMDTIRQVGAQMRNDTELGKDITDDIEVWGINKLGDNAVLITGRLKTTVGTHWATGRVFLQRLKKAFEEAGIDPNPNPQQIMLFQPGGAPLRISQVADA